MPDPPSSQWTMCTTSCITFCSSNVILLLFRMHCCVICVRCSQSFQTIFSVVSQGNGYSMDLRLHCPQSHSRAHQKHLCEQGTSFCKQHCLGVFLTWIHVKKQRCEWMWLHCCLNILIAFSGFNNSTNPILQPNTTKVEPVLHFWCVWQLNKAPNVCQKLASVSQSHNHPILTGTKWTKVGMSPKNQFPATPSFVLFWFEWMVQACSPS